MLGFAQNAMRTCVLGAAMAGLAATAASARDTVEYDVVMPIPQACGWANGGRPASSIDLGDLSIAGSRPVPLRFDCNTPFRVRVSAENGAMTYQWPDAALRARYEGKAGSIPYRVALDLNARNLRGDVVSRDAQCRSSGLANGGPCRLADEGVGFANGVALAADAALPGSALTISWDAQNAQEQALFAGVYSDVVTITVEAAP